ncbi:MAG: hypothetical protein FJX23_04835 [Alphaproteobacteria bacterium]|nr:hypothetical protein [Alphaproteobacteria bacterium]
MAKIKTSQGFDAAQQGKQGLFGKLFSKGKGAEQAAVGLAHGVGHAGKSAIQKPGVFLSSVSGATAGIGSAHGALSRVNQYVFGIGILAGGLAAMGKLPFVGKAFASAAEAVVKPKEYMEKTSVEEFAHVGSSSLGKLKARVAGKNPDLAGKLGAAESAFSSAEASVMGVVGQGAKTVSTRLGDLTEQKAGGLLSRLAERVSGKAGAHSAKASGLLDSLLEHDVLSEAGDAAKKAFAAGDTEGLQTAIGGLKETIGGLPKGTFDRKTLRDLNKATEGFGEAALAATEKSGLAGKIADLPNAIRNAPETVSKMNLSNVALKGALVTGTALQITGTAKGIGEKVHVLKQVHSDLTGEQKISTRKVLFSKNVPPIVKELRSQIIKEYGPRLALNLANTVATYTFMKGGGVKSMIGSAGLMAATSLHGAKVQGYGVLPMYQALNQAPQINDLQYAQFITAASKDAAAAGGIESPLVRALAQDYAQEGTRPGDILKEIQSGKFDERALAKVQASREAQNAGQTAAVPQQREAVGAYTQRELDRSSQLAASGQARG